MTYETMSLGERLHAARVRGRGVTAKMATKSKLLTIALLLFEAFALTPGTARATPRYNRWETWLSCSLAATSIMTVSLIIFYWVGGFDLAKHMPALGPISGGTTSQIGLAFTGFLILTGVTLVWCGSDYAAGYMTRLLRWHRVVPAPFGYYVVSACAAWTWMALALLIIAIGGSAVTEPFWRWLAAGSTGALVLYLAVGLAVYWAHERRSALVRVYHAEVHGGGLRALRNMFVFQFAPLAAIVFIILRSPPVA